MEHIKLDDDQDAARIACAATFIDAAIAAGKPIRAVREHYIRQHMLDSSHVKEIIDWLPSMDCRAATSGCLGVEIDEAKRETFAAR